MHIKERSVLCLMLIRRVGSGCCLEAVKLNCGWLGLVGMKSNERITIGSWGRCPKTVMQHSTNTLMTGTPNYLDLLNAISRYQDRSCTTDTKILSWIVRHQILTNPLIGLLDRG